MVKNQSLMEFQNSVFRLFHFNDSLFIAFVSSISNALASTKAFSVLFTLGLRVTAV